MTVKNKTTHNARLITLYANGNRMQFRRKAAYEVPNRHSSETSTIVNKTAVRGNKTR